jgi:hypothetical protein
MSVWSEFLRWFKYISAKEEFADILANVLLDDKLSTRMIEREIFDIKNQVIYYHKVFSFLNSFSELFDCDFLVNVNELVLSSLLDLMNGFQYSKDQNKSKHVHYS